MVAAIVTAKVGGDWMAWHLRCGEAVLALLAFRWAWGLVGGHWSRFATFLPTPARLARAVRGRAGADDGVGHNPLGALSVWAFLLLLSVQVATGLVADDEIATTGPLNAHVGSHLARRASGWHAARARISSCVIALTCGCRLVHVAPARPRCARGGRATSPCRGPRPPAATSAGRDALAVAVCGLAMRRASALLVRLAA